MKNIKYKVISIICTVVLAVMTLGLPEHVFAAGISVSASAGTVYVGDTVTFTVSASNGAGYVTVSGAASEYSWIESGTPKSYSVTASNVGTITLSASGVLGDYDKEEDVKVFDSASVTVIARPTNNEGNSGGNSNNSGNSGSNSSGGSTQTPQTPQTSEKEEDPKSSDSSLASLSIKEGKLSPEFKAGTTSYKVSLAEGTTSVNVSAKANDAKARVSGTGEVKVKAGSNKISLTVTAEDGSTTVYTITADVKEKAVATMELNGKSLDVYQNPQGANLDNKAFEKTTVKINDSEVPAWKSEAQKLTLLYLDGEDGNDFYIYDEASKKVTSIYRPVGILGKNIVMIDVPENLQKRDGMKFTSVEIDKVTFPGWTFEDSTFENYALIYVMDGQGKYVYYQYDKSENTLQLFSGAAAITQEKYEAYVKEKEDKEQTLMYVIYGLTAGCVVLLGLAGFFFVRRKPSMPKHRKVDIEKEDYENRFHIEKED